VVKIIVRHEIVSVRAKEYVSHQSSTLEKPKGKFFSLSGNAPEVSSLGCEAAGSTTKSYNFLKVCPISFL